MYIVGPAALLYIVFELLKFNKIEKQKMVAALVFIIFSVVFWAFFEQAGGSLSLFARYNLHSAIIPIDIFSHHYTIPINPNEVNNSANSLFVIIFSPLFGLLWLWMIRKKIEPNTVVKFGLGFLFLGGAFYVFYYTRFFADAQGFTSLNVFTFAYLVITIGELCLSPIGLSLMTKLAPQRLHGMMMGMWFLASAYGQYAAGILGAGMATADEKASLTVKLISYTEGYKQLAIYALVAGVVLIVISPLLRKLMHDVH
jgi:POT family proton-dependent oligopeptide transporter